MPFTYTANNTKSEKSVETVRKTCQRTVNASFEAGVRTIRSVGLYKKSIYSTNFFLSTIRLIFNGQLY